MTAAGSIRRARAAEHPALVALWERSVRATHDFLSEADFDHEVLNADEPVLVDFWADWCTPCHAVAPVLERIAAEHELKLVKIDYDQEQRLAERYGVHSIPNIILFEDGAPRAQTIGAQPKNALERALGLAG